MTIPLSSRHHCQRSLPSCNQLMRQGKATPEDNSKRKRRAASGRIQTCNVLCTRQILYQLSHRGSSAGQAESLMFMQGKGCLSPDGQGNQSQYYYMYMYMTVHGSWRSSKGLHSVCTEVTAIMYMYMQFNGTVPAPVGLQQSSAYRTSSNCMCPVSVVCSG